MESSSSLCDLFPARHKTTLHGGVNAEMNPETLSESPCIKLKWLKLTQYCRKLSVNTDNWGPDSHGTGSKGMLCPTAAGKTPQLTFLFQAVFQCYEVLVEYKINLRIIAVEKLLQVTSIHNVWKEEQTEQLHKSRRTRISGILQI